MTYDKALAALTDACENVDAHIRQRPTMRALTLNLAPGMWSEREYPLAHTLARAATEYPGNASLNAVAVAIGRVRDAEWAEYGAEYV
jgi:hypothetical protein